MGIKTREAYQNCYPGKPCASLFQLINLPINEWKGSIINDFEEFVFNRHPLIADIKNELYTAGAMFSLMSGSGSTVYGIFKEKPDLGSKLKKFVLFEGMI
jgi:4-diphosphocytidyl-2-C-methyl-D-erythritol kinase